MDLALLHRLIREADPLQVLYDALTGTIWTPERLAEARRQGDFRAYLREGEHAASTLEREVYAVYSDVYALLEAPHDPRRDLVGTLEPWAQYTLLLLDGLSLRELPLLQEVLAAHGLAAASGFALAPLPTETSEFARHHYNAAGPSDLAGRAARLPFAFRHVKNESWRPDFAPGERQRFIWCAFPDDYFSLKETDYARHVVQPIAAILEAVLSDPTLLRPLVITGDHGYLWQGGHCAWALAPDERAVLAAHFKQGRSTDTTTDALAATGKVWVRGNVAAARGRFAWGGLVRGAGSLFKHGGVSLLECLVPWVVG